MRLRQPRPVRQRGARRGAGPRRARDRAHLQRCPARSTGAGRLRCARPSADEADDDCRGGRGGRRGRGDRAERPRTRVDDYDDEDEDEEDMTRRAAPSPPIAATARASARTRRAQARPTPPPRAARRRSPLAGRPAAAAAPAATGRRRRRRRRRGRRRRRRGRRGGRRMRDEAQAGDVYAWAWPARLGGDDPYEWRGPVPQSAAGGRRAGAAAEPAPRPAAATASRPSRRGGRRPTGSTASAVPSQHAARGHLGRTARGARQAGRSRRSRAAAAERRPRPSRHRGVETQADEAARRRRGVVAVEPTAVDTGPSSATAAGRPERRSPSPSRSPWPNRLAARPRDEPGRRPLPRRPWPHPIRPRSSRRPPLRGGAGGAGRLTRRRASGRRSSARTRCPVGRQPSRLDVSRGRIGTAASDLPSPFARLKTALAAPRCSACSPRRRRRRFAQGDAAASRSSATPRSRPSCTRRPIRSSPPPGSIRRTCGSTSSATRR